METSTHTFPLPEAESDKLAAVTDQLRHQPRRQKFNDFIRAHAWSSVWVTFGLGIAAGVALKLAR